MRFSKDKTPYKTHRAPSPSGHRYIQIRRPEYGWPPVSHAEADVLAAIRQAIDNDLFGPELENILATLAKSGWEIGGDQLKTAPTWLAQRPPPYRTTPPQIHHRHNGLRLRPVIHTAAPGRPGPQGLAPNLPFVDWITTHSLTWW